MSKAYEKFLKNLQTIDNLEKSTNAKINKLYQKNNELAEIIKKENLIKVYQKYNFDRIEIIKNIWSEIKILQDRKNPMSQMNLCISVCYILGDSYKIYTDQVYELIQYFELNKIEITNETNEEFEKEKQKIALKVLTLNHFEPKINL